LALSELHREAHQIEHTLSKEVEARLQSEMADPRLCPHGNPLPGFEGEVSQWISLSAINAGSSVVVKRIHENIEDDYERLSFLEKEGLIPGARILVEEVLAFNETIRIKVNNKDVVLGLRLADQIFVAEDPENNQVQS
jgi:DtxR family Mn-dependent transcriptional regulator